MINRIGVNNISATGKNNSTNNNRQIFLEKTNNDIFSINTKQQKTDLSFKNRIVNNMKKADLEFTASALCFAATMISPIFGEISLTPLLFAFLIPIIGKLVRK